MTAIICMTAIVMFVLALCICVQGVDQKDGFVFGFGAALFVAAALVLVFH